jgi:hypothetical protein
MKRLRASIVRLGGLFHAERREHELAAELESHLQLHIEDNLRSGMTPEQLVPARHTARSQSFTVADCTVLDHKSQRPRDRVPQMAETLPRAGYAALNLDSG